MMGMDTNSSLNNTAAASVDTVAPAVDSAGGAQNGGNGQVVPSGIDAANAFTSSGGLCVSPSQQTPPPPPYNLALSMPLSPRRGLSAVTKVPSADISPWASSSPGAHTKAATTTSPLDTGATAPGAAGAGAAESILHGSQTPPPYEEIFSPKARNAAEDAEAPGGDSGASWVTPTGLDQGEPLFHR